MLRWETYLALLAVVFASLSDVKFGGHPRPALAFAAIALRPSSRMRGSVRNSRVVESRRTRSTHTSVLF